MFRLAVFIIASLAGCIHAQNTYEPGLGVLKTYGQALDIESLGKLRYFSESYPDMDFELIVWNDTNQVPGEYTLDYHEYDLSSFDSIPYFNISDDNTSDIASPQIAARAPIIQRETCYAHTDDAPKCNWLSTKRHRDYLCHIPLGLSSISGGVGLAVIVNGIGCGPGTPGAWQTVLGITWSIASVTAASASLNLCPLGLEELANCKGSGQLAAGYTDAKYDTVFDYNVDANNYLTCDDVKNLYGSDRIKCKAVPADKDEL